ncbi:MAG: YaiI/YqxD family protein [Deltaproteobacteria bacterium]|nr:YaiI/YqxD family protein [Deltaproteobacteria bacterium]MBM4317767.1 YaiI/YqxD family protein [Deltaproteobacteria bacterium]
MEIYIDADACPVKESVFKVAQRYGIKVFVVSNHPKLTPKSDSIVSVVVEKTFDAVDDWISGQIKTNDLVVSNDVLLAERCIKKGALAIDPRGKILDENNIGEAVSMRELLSELRSRGDLTTGPKAMGKKHQSNFLANLDKVINQLKRK